MAQDKGFFNKEAVRTMKKDIAALKGGTEPPKSAAELNKPEEVFNFEKQPDISAASETPFGQSFEKMEEARRKKDEELRKFFGKEKQQEEEKKLEQEATRQQEENKIRVEEEKKRRQAEEESRVGEERLRVEKLEKEMLASREVEEKRRQEEKIALENQRQQEEARRIKEEEEKKKIQEQEVRVEEERKKAEEKKREVEEEKKKVEDEAKRRQEEDKKKQEDPKYKKQTFLQEKNKLESDRRKLRASVGELERQKKDTEFEKNKFLREISEVERIFKGLVLKEEQVEQDIKKIEEKEAVAVESRDKRRIERERQSVERKRRELEEKRWPFDEKISQFETKISEFEEKHKDIEASQAVIIQQEKEISGKEENINFEIEKIDLSERLRRLKEMKEQLLQKKESLGVRETEIKDKLNAISDQEEDAEDVKKIAEEKEKSAVLPKEKREAEKERWRAEEERERIEAQRWQLERENEKISSEGKVIEDNIKGIVKAGEEIIARIKEINSHLGVSPEKAEPKEPVKNINSLQDKKTSDIKQKESPVQIKKTALSPAVPPPQPKTQAPSPSPQPEVGQQDSQSREKIEEAWKRIEALKKQNEERKAVIQNIAPAASAPAPKINMQENKPSTPQQPNKIEPQKSPFSEAAKQQDSFESRILHGPRSAVSLSGGDVPRPQERQNPLPQNFSAKEILKNIPPKPSSSHKLWVRFLIGGIIIVVLALTVTFWAWYFLQNNNSVVGCLQDADCPSGTYCNQDGICVQQSTAEKCLQNSDCGQGQICDTDGKCKVENISFMPNPFFMTEATREISVSSPDEIQPILSQVMLESMDPGRFKYIPIKDQAANKYEGLKYFIDAMRVRVPAEIYQKLQEDSITLYIYSQVQGNRIGFVAKIKDKNGLADILKQMETNITDDFKPFFDLVMKGQKPVAATFKAAKEQYKTYDGPDFRFRTYAKNDVGAVYLISDNYFVLTSSWESMLKIIDRLGIKQAPGVITKDLSLGMKDKEVETLQIWLAKDPIIYPDKKVTGYFGPATKQAVIKFQEKYFTDILAPQALTKGNGMVDLLTRTKLNTLYGNSSSQ
jgi:hypothetical protein